MGYVTALGRRRAAAGGKSGLAPMVCPECPAYTAVTLLSSWCTGTSSSALLGHPPHPLDCGRDWAGPGLSQRGRRQLQPHTAAPGACPRKGPHSDFSFREAQHQSSPVPGLAHCQGLVVSGSDLLALYFTSVLPVCFVCGGLGPHAVMFRGYSCLCRIRDYSGITPGRLEVPYEVPEVEPGSAACEANSPPDVLSLLPMHF